MSDLQAVVSFAVTEKAMRPASDKRQCFYCRQLIGGNHKHDCILINKKVKVRLTVEYEVEVPNYWGKENIEFHRNDGVWCSDNAISELDKFFAGDDAPCMCSASEFEYLGGDTVPFLNEQS